RQLAPYGDGVALHGGNRRLGATLEELERLLETVRLDPTGLALRRELAQVEAGAENAARARHHHDADVRPCGHLGEGGVEGLDHLGTERVALLGPVEGDGADVFGDAAQDQVGHQKRSFKARTAAKSATGSAGSSAGICAPTEAASSGLSMRRNGLVTFASPIVLGTVTFPSRRRACTAASLTASVRFPGSNMAAKRRFFSVYSRPQQTRVPSGRAASVACDAGTGAASPPKGRPQPAAERATPAT